MSLAAQIALLVVFFAVLYLGRVLPSLWLWRRRVAAGKATPGLRGFYRDDLRRSMPFLLVGAVAAIVAAVFALAHR
jgi:hypothetical protein